MTTTVTTIVGAELLRGRPEARALLTLARLLDDINEGGAHVEGLGGNVLGVTAFRSTPRGVRCQIVVTYDGPGHPDDGEITVSACPMAPAGCGPEAGRMWEDGHDHVDHDAVFYADAVDEVPDMVRFALEQIDDEGVAATVADLTGEMAEAAARYAASQPEPLCVEHTYLARRAARIVGAAECALHGGHDARPAEWFPPFPS